MPEQRPIRPFGIGLYWCPSFTDPGTDYLVDMSDPHWLTGRCNCIDFEKRIENVIERCEKPERWTCIHIDRVRKENAV